MAQQMTPMQKAKAQLLLQHPFWAALVMSTEWIEDRSIPTACTNMTWVRYNPDFFAKLEPAVVLFVLVHEIMHVMFKHGLRMNRRNAQVWNQACDHAINLKLKEWGFTLWEHCCQDVTYKGMSAEDIYDILMKEKEDEDEGGGRGKGPKGEGDGEPTDMDSDLQEPDQMDNETIDKVDREISRKIVQATQIAKMAGRMPADLDRMLNGILDPKVPWYEELQDFMSRVVHDEETWAHRNRRFRNVYLPTRRNESMGEIIVIGDTSGSMGQAELEQAAGEINGIARQARPERIRVIWADDKDVSHMECFEQGEDMVFHPKGGGGTDMRKPLKFVEQFDPLIVILLTDCYTPWPTVEPDFPLIVVASTNAPCPVGRVIRMKPSV